jgi:hypothetical protein
MKMRGFAWEQNVDGFPPLSAVFALRVYQVRAEWAKAGNLNPEQEFPEES